MRTLLTALCAAIAVGCSSSPPAGSDSGMPDGGTADSGPADSGSADSGPADSGVSDAGIPDAGNATFTVQIGPLNVDGGSENTQCVIVSAGNSAPVRIEQLHTQLAGAAFQMALYKVAPTAPSLTPFDCPSLGGLSSSSAIALTITKNADQVINLPAGTAFSFDANQMLQLELHFSNPASTSATAQATVSLTTLSQAQYQNEAGLLWVDDHDISVPPGGIAMSNAYVPLSPALGPLEFFALNGDEHARGTQLQIWSAASAADPGTLLYQSTNWQDPPTAVLQPPTAVPADGGFKLQCDWTNATQQNLVAGPGATNEACNFAAYYFPGLDAGTAQCFFLNGNPFCVP